MPTAQQASTRQDFYADPLVYDVLHQQDTVRDARALRRIAATFGVPSIADGSRRWFEPASGSGRYILALAKLGDRGVGIDLSRAMVRFARGRARATDLAGRAGFFAADMTAFSSQRPRGVGTFHAAFNLINSIRHLPRDGAMLAHLACVRSVLEPGGVYVVGLSLHAPGLEQPTEDVWRGSRDGLRVTQVVQYIPPQRGKRNERVVSHMTIREGRGKERRERHVDSSYTLRTYSLAQWRSVLAAGGWEVAGVTDHLGGACVAHQPGYFLFVLRPTGAKRGRGRGV